ncbi:MAG TPA: 1-acyl-sn-glycerol-3-phosphate acyltransferase [Chitinispirillaceae bacterium]|nr:1-acyl-sn-glycerol-3-phosphate acyltransferase [Chitinispirillaceae bacterium]
MSSYDRAIQDVSGSVQRFFDTAFTGIEVSGPDLNSSEIQKCPLMLVSTHRSHVDYFLVGHVFFGKGFRGLRFAAGDNLTNLPYLGPRFKKWGAFPVSRDTGFERNYVRNLCKSVKSMLEGGQAVILFPEGGRSYSGATLDVKYGILGASVLLQAEKPQNDVYLLPMAISYEYPPDLPYFRMLLKGKQLRKRSNPLYKRILGNLMYFGADILAYAPVVSSRYTGKKYGKIFLDYEEPVTVREIVDVVAGRLENARDEFSSHRASMQKVSEYIQNKFLNLYRILPVHLVSFVLKEGKGSAPEQISEQIPVLLEGLSAANRNLKQVRGEDPRKIVETGMQQLLRLKAISLKKDSVIVNKPEIVDYYAASIRM